ncbi:MAG: LysE family transporter [Hyphomicrobium sp.]|nr:LysE family transporter [Hyphomicrobium sp.]
MSVASLVPNPLVIPVGLAIGLLVAAPVGPVNIICIQRAIERGFYGGLAAGFGALIGDGLLALLAALGVSWIAAAVTEHRSLIQVVGGLVLVVVGTNLYFARPRELPQVAESDGTSFLAMLSDIPKTFFLTVSNPGAVLFMFATLGGTTAVMKLTSVADVFAMVVAIITGSLAWWIALSWIVGHYRSRIDLARLQNVNRVAGVLLIGFGAFLLAEVCLTLAAAAR